MSETEETRPMAKVPPPPPRQKRGLHVEIPTLINEPPPSNMQKANSGIQDLNFKVDPEFHQHFKIAAAVRGMAMKELLEASFRCWVEINGDETLKAMIRPKE